MNEESWKKVNFELILLFTYIYQEDPNIKFAIFIIKIILVFEMFHYDVYERWCYYLAGLVRI